MSGSAVERFHARIVDEHLDELRFMLHLRAHRLPFAHGDVHEWLAFDRRLIAHVDGLLLRPAMAWARAEALLRARPRTQTLQLGGVLALNLADESSIDRWFALAATASTTVRAADEITHWVLPERIAPLMALLVDDGLAGELPLAVALELAQRLRLPPEHWATLAGHVLAFHAPSDLLARAVCRVSVAEAAAAWAQLAQHHPQARTRLAAGCAGVAAGQRPPTLIDAAALGPEATMRTALRLPEDALPQQLRALFEAGERLACACAVTALGELRWAAQVAPEPGEEPDRALAHALLFETLTGHPPDRQVAEPAVQVALRGEARTLERCLHELRHGDCVARLVCAQVLLVKAEAFDALDVMAPMWRQLKHPALSTAGSIEPSTAH